MPAASADGEQSWDMGSDPATVPLPGARAAGRGPEHGSGGGGGGRSRRAGGRAPGRPGARTCGHGRVEQPSHRPRPGRGLPLPPRRPPAEPGPAGAGDTRPGPDRRGSGPAALPRLALPIAPALGLGEVPGRADVRGLEFRRSGFAERWRMLRAGAAGSGLSGDVEGRRGTHQEYRRLGPAAGRGSPLLLLDKGLQGSELVSERGCDIPGVTHGNE